MLSKLAALNNKWDQSCISVNDFYTGPESNCRLIARWKDIERNAEILNDFRWPNMENSSAILSEPFFLVNFEKFRIMVLPEMPAPGQLPQNVSASADKGFPKTVFTAALKGLIYDVCGFTDIIGVLLIKNYLNPNCSLARCNIKNACELAKDMAKTPYTIPREVQSCFGNHGSSDSWLSSLYDLRSELIHKNTSRLKFDEHTFTFIELSFSKGEWVKLQKGFPSSTDAAPPETYSIHRDNVGQFAMEIKTNLEKFIDDANRFPWPKVSKPE